MFTEILKFKPQVDRAALNRMLRDLSSRFTRVARTFGRGLRNALKLAPFLAIGGALLTKLLNPLKKAEEVLDRILKMGDDAATDAEQLGSEPGTLLRLQAISQAKGVDSQTLKMLLTRFQVALAKEQEQSKVEGYQPGRLKEFVDETDTSQAFFKFLQAMQKVDRSQQIVVQAEIFGERVLGRAAELFNATDFERILDKLPSAEKLTEAAKRTAKISDERDLLTSIRESEDFITKSQIVNENMLTSIDRAEREKLKAEDEDLKRFDSLKNMSANIQELTTQFSKLSTDLLEKSLPTITDGLALMGEGFRILTPAVVKIADWLDTGLDGVVRAIVNTSNTIGNYWNEFKSSRLYKYFGG